MAKEKKEKKKKLKPEQPFSAIKTILIYIPVSLIVILIFRVVFPSQAAPLPVFSVKWRLTQGVIDFISLFPALCIASLTISFGFQRVTGETYNRFSTKFLDVIKGHILAAIIITTLHALLYLLVYPLALDYQSTMTFNSYLFRTSRDRAAEKANEESWIEAGQFLAICERIWPNSREIESLHNRIFIGLESMEMSNSNKKDQSVKGIPRNWVPVNALEAYDMAKKAFDEERYYDAHWLSALAGRLAGSQSAERLQFSLLAAKAWNAISSLEPNSRERQTYMLYHKKQEGYNALISEEWIHAYYVFKELSLLTPNDPDVTKFLAMSEAGLLNVAFFIEEMDMAIGEVLTGAVFSIPRRDSAGNPNGRVILRFASLSNFPDFSYALGIEALGFNRDGSLIFRLEAPYGKILPLTTGSIPGAKETVLLLRALGREDKDKKWEPTWQGTERSELGGGQLSLNILYSDFLLSAKSRRGLEGLSIQDLIAGAGRLGSRGHIAEIFEAEILHRIAEPVILLPMTIVAIIIGWRFKAVKKPRYMGIPMLVLIPAVFAFAMAYLRTICENAGILLMMTMSFTAAMALFIGLSMLLFILSLIILAGQHT